MSETHTLKKGPIIIIDDDQDDCDLLRHIIDNIAPRSIYRFFANGQLALDYFLQTSEQPFVIFCDINMPIMSGLELSKRISENEYLRQKSIPFIFLTTSRNPGEIRKAYELTVQGYFQKPSTANTFEELVKSILDYWDRCLHPNSIK